MENILLPKYRKGHKPARVRKTSRPLDGINRRLLREQAEHVAALDNAPATRAEIEAKAIELGLKFDGRTSDAKLLQRINDALKVG